MLAGARRRCPRPWRLAATGAFAGTAEAATSTAGTRGLRASLVHAHRAAVQIGAVQLGNRVLRLVGVRHFDEREAAGLSGVTVGHEVDALSTFPNWEKVACWSFCVVE